MRTFIHASLGFVLAFLVLIATFYTVQYSQNARASVVAGNEYMATTTHPLSPSVMVLKTGYGAVAQVTITGTNTGLLTLYNATTSNASLRAASKATSSIVIADFPASAPAGTYTFDASFTDGLLVVESGLAPTTTITYR